MKGFSSLLPSRKEEREVGWEKEVETGGGHYGRFLPFPVGDVIAAICLAFVRRQNCLSFARFELKRISQKKGFCWRCRFCCSVETNSRVKHIQKTIVNCCLWNPSSAGSGKEKTLEKAKQPRAPLLFLRAAFQVAAAAGRLLMITSFALFLPLGEKDGADDDCSSRIQRSD